MKILEINKFFYAKGGADKHFLDVVELLEKEGHEVAVFSMDSPHNKVSPWSQYFPSYVGYLAKDSLWQRLKGLARIYSFESRRKIKKLLDDFKPEVVHIHNIYHQISPSILSVIKKRGIPIVMTVHDYSLICPNYNFAFQNTDWEELGNFRSLKFILKKGFKNSYFQSLLAILEYWFLRLTKIYEKNIDLFIAPSQFLKDKLVKEGMDEKKIVILPHFSQLTADKKAIQESFIFHYGRLSESKGTQDIIDIFKDLPNLKLRLAGNMEEGLDFKNQNNIEYLGFLSPKEIQKQIQRCLFVISASRLPETFGLVALEALSCGKPFVALERGAYVEIIDDGKTGYLCQDKKELAKKITLLSENALLREEMSQRAQEKAGKFSAEKYYAQIEPIFKDLAHKSLNGVD